MAVLKTNFKGTEIRCLNMPFTNDTLVVAPSMNGERFSIIIYGKQIAENIVKSNKLTKMAYNLLEKEYKKYRSLVAC
jgi:hypothetical protein